MIGVLGIFATFQAPSALVTCDRGATGELTVQSPSVVMADSPGAARFHVRLDISNVPAARQTFPGGEIHGIPTQVTGNVTLFLQPGEKPEITVPLSGTAAGDRIFMTGHGTLDPGKAAPGMYQLHATNLAISVPSAGPCRVSDTEPVGEFFMQPGRAPAGGESHDTLVAVIQRLMMALVIVAAGVFIYTNRPERLRRDRRPHTAGPPAPTHIKEPAGFEARPHLRFFRTFASMTAGGLLTLGLAVSCVIDRHTTVEDLPRLPGQPSAPAPPPPPPAGNA
ncbi:hypothetical protein BKM31_09565 [[Actinomadura] parvosata subsp. kistnae]|uniref:Uncharacterized protein n=1 Tax=[Actinomadura] parvosata subsp. kistnae TaxID=1909395 RepID=A0A1U9ZUQ9_9ACTN|nr:hypothetical protein BKM31_09565 [Nonomuraea sp. ATCC 55076]